MLDEIDSKKKVEEDLNLSDIDEEKLKAEMLKEGVDLE
jgi:hypothetical protein